MTPSQLDSVDRLIDISSDLTGQAAGAAIGFFLGGPVGATVGIASAPLAKHLFQKVADDLKQRLLGPREEIRIGTTFTFAAAKISESIQNGRHLRQDDFFQSQPNDRSAAEEVLEGVLLAAQREHEEKKLQFYSNLVANIAFDTTVYRGEANFLLRQAQVMSYRQMCLLSFFARIKDFGINWNNWVVGNIPQKSVVQDIRYMHDQGIFKQLLLGTSNYYPVDGFILTDVRTDETGRKLFDLMELFTIPQEDLIQIVELLNYPGSQNEMRDHSG